MTGTVKKKTDRGFGFIAINGQDNDLFFHSTALNGVTFDQLQEGATVSFEVKDSGDGRQSATNVQLAEVGAPATEPEVTEMTAEAAPMEEASPVENATEEEAAQPIEEAPATEETPKTA